MNNNLKNLSEKLQKEKMDMVQTIASLQNTIQNQKILVL